MINKGRVRECLNGAAWGALCAFLAMLFGVGLAELLLRLFQ